MGVSLRRQPTETAVISAVCIGMHRIEQINLNEALGSSLVAISTGHDGYIRWNRCIHRTLTTQSILLGLIP
jgi:hypothetical protein